MGASNGASEHMAKNITVTQAEQLIKASKGTIFTATFVKRNGKTRRLNGRTGVSKGLTGKGRAYNPSDYGILPVFDLYEKQYRSLRFNALTGLTVRGRKFNVTGGGQS